MDYKYKQTTPPLTASHFSSLHTHTHGTLLILREILWQNDDTESLEKSKNHFKHYWDQGLPLRGEHYFYHPANEPDEGVLLLEVIYLFSLK